MASLAHDIRTPLTGILALSELLAASDLSERERRWANAIRSAAEHLAQSTTLVLDAVKADAAGLVLRREAFSPRRFAEAIAASLSARAGISGLSADISIADDLPQSVTGDRVRLRAALENLVDNAVKFTARGGITFRVSAQPMARQRVKLGFAVGDSGVGMTAAEIRKLFRPFAQASDDVSRRFGGTGLGLVLVKRLAKAMGGDLTVTSRPGKGSTFTLTVVAERGPDLPAAERENGQAETEAQPLRILGVEPSPFGRVVLSTMLTGLGHSVDFVGGGDAAVSAVTRGGYDLVLMSSADDIEITQRIRALPEAGAGIPIIGILAAAGEQKRAMAAGMTDHLVKPVSAAALAEALARVRSFGSPG